MPSNGPWEALACPCGVVAPSHESWAGFRPRPLTPWTHLKMIHRRTLLLVVPLLSGCGGADPAPVPAQGDPAVGPQITLAAPAGREITFDREIVFLSSSPDSMVIVPWFFRNRSTTEGLFRESQGWLSQGAGWEVLALESSASPSMRTPWRIVPGERIRVIVGEEDRLEAVLLRDPPRVVETQIGDFLVEWVRPGGDPIRLFQGRTTFPSGPIAGTVLDLSRRWDDPSLAPGDWLLLQGPDDFHLFLEEIPPIREPRELAVYRGWTRNGYRTESWPSMEVDWVETRSYERARRDIPVRWTIHSPGGEIQAEVTTVSSFLSVGEGDGPILPVRALYGISGTARILGEVIPVVGVVRHIQR